MATETADRDGLRHDTNPAAERPASNPSATLLLKRAHTDEAATAMCCECERPLDVVVPLDSRWVMCSACAVNFGWEINNGS